MPRRKTFFLGYCREGLGREAWEEEEGGQAESERTSDTEMEPWHAIFLSLICF